MDRRHSLIVGKRDNKITNPLEIRDCWSHSIPLNTMLPQVCVAVGRLSSKAAGRQIPKHCVVVGLLIGSNLWSWQRANDNVIPVSPLQHQRSLLYIGSRSIPRRYFAAIAKQTREAAKVVIYVDSQRMVDKLPIPIRRSLKAKHPATSSHRFLSGCPWPLPDHREQG